MMPPSAPIVRRLKRIAPLQLGKIFALLCGAMGLLIIPLMLVATLLTAGVSGRQPMSVSLLTGGFAILAPFLYAVMGFITGAIGAWFYNLIAKWIGGIEVEFE